MGVLLAQYWGANDPKGLRRNFALGALVASLASFLIFLFCWTVPEIVPAMFKVGGETAALTTEYLKIISIALLVAGPSIAMDAALRALGKIKTTFYMFFIEIGLNILISFILIFGHFGLPVMGLEGAGWGTVIARLFRVFMSLFVIGIFDKVLILGPSDFRFRKSTFQIYANVTAPVIAGSLIWSGGIFTYQLIMGRMGENELAAMAISTWAMTMTWFTAMKVMTPSWAVKVMIPWKLVTMMITSWMVARVLTYTSVAKVTTPCTSTRKTSPTLIS